MYGARRRIRHKDGSVRWIWARGHGVFAPDGSLRFIEGLNLDMTHQKQAEEALRESEQRWRSLTEALPQLVWSATPDGCLIYFGGTMDGVHRHCRGGLARLAAWLETLHPDDRRPTRAPSSKSVARHPTPYDIEYPRSVPRRRAMFRAWFKTRGVPIPRHRREYQSKWFGTCTDITGGGGGARPRPLRGAARGGSAGTFENAAVGIGHRHLDGRFLRVNQRFCHHPRLPSRTSCSRGPAGRSTHPDDLDSRR